MPAPALSLAPPRPIVRGAAAVARAGRPPAPAPPRGLGLAFSGARRSPIMTPRPWSRPPPAPEPGGRMPVTPPHALPQLLDPASTEPFLFFNTIVLFPWALMILAPRWEWTRKLLDPIWFMVPYCLIDTIYFFATAVVDAEAGADVNAKVAFLFTEAIADPDKMLSLFDSSAYAAQDWVHLCTWDMLAGRWIWLDSLTTGVPVRFALLTCFSSGPPGLLIYLVTRGLLQKSEAAGGQVTKV